ncbi:MAG: DivIVA domain-containing protein [Oscillospiraceae bacterium]
MTSEDIRRVTFERSMRGYRTEDVDDFLQQTAAAMDALAAEKEDIENKLYVLAQKVEEYRGQEETLKTALINAQRMGETVIHEAKQKSESMMREATGKAEILRQQAEQEINNERFMLEKLREEVTRFKTTVLSLYKQHIESFSALDAPVLRVEEFLADYRPEAENKAAANSAPAENGFAARSQDIPDLNQDDEDRAEAAAKGKAGHLFKDGQEK